VCVGSRLDRRGCVVVGRGGGVDGSGRGQNFGLCFSTEKTKEYCTVFPTTLSACHLVTWSGLTTCCSLLSLYRRPT